MELVIARGAYKRQRGAFVPWRQVNMLLEATPTDPKQYNLHSRPPLAEAFSWGAGPVAGVFQRDGVLNGDRFSVSGGRLYREGVDKGAISGSGPCKFAALAGELVITRGANAHSYIDDNLATIAFPDGANVRSVHSMARLFVYVRGDDSGRFYWSALNDGRTIDPLDFANAESEPDRLLDIAKNGDVFWLLGSTSGEAWVLSGDSNLPWAPVAQRKISKGVRAPGCAEEIGGTVYFIANDNSVCRIEADANPISDPGMEESIRASAAALAFQYSFEGKTVFCFRLDSGTFGIETGALQPVEFQTAGRDNWAPLCASNNGGAPLFGDDTTGQVWAFGAFTPTATDSGADTLPRIFSAGAPLNAQPFSVFNVLVDGNSGDTVLDSAPILEMRVSRDGGKNWGAWDAVSWGAAGDYLRQARFGAKGAFNPPGFLAEFRMVDMADLRVSNVRANEPLSGRARAA